MKASTCAAISTGHCSTTSSGSSATHRGSVWSRSTGKRSRATRSPARGGWAMSPAAGGCLPLRELCDLAQHVWIGLRLAIEGQEPVALLLHVGQLRVAKSLHRTGLGQRLDHLAIRLDELIDAAGHRPPEPA